MTDASPTVGHVPREIGRSVFGQDAKGYHLGRLSYPREIFARLFERAPGHSLNLLEIGAGTGIATTDLLHPRVDRLIAIEPDRELAKLLRAEVQDPRLHVRLSTFEEAVLRPRSFDIIACASSFHWLDRQKTLSRVRELLQPGGIFAAWWNVYRQPNSGDPFADAVIPLLADLALPPSEAKGSHYALETEARMADLVAGGLKDVEALLVRRDRILDTSELMSLYGSYSFVRALDVPRRERLLRDIRLLAEQRFGGRIPNVVHTALYMASAD